MNPQYGFKVQGLRISTSKLNRVMVSQRVCFSKFVNKVYLTLVPGIVTERLLQLFSSEVVALNRTQLVVKLSISELTK